MNEAWSKSGVAKEDMVKPGMLVVCLCGLALASLCLALQPDEATALYDKGVLLLGAGKPFEALEAFTEAIARRPGYAEAYCGQGDAYSKTSRYPLAILAYTQAIKLRPAYADALSGRGFAHYFAEEYGPAEEDFTAAIKADAGKAEPIVSFLVRELEMVSSSRKGK
jgi:tetratricopeptide (TPR) repeat protein